MLTGTGRSRGLIALIAFQCLCTIFFLSDVLADIGVVGWSSLTDLHLLPELGASLGLIIGIVIEIQVLLKMLRRQVDMKRGLDVAAGALAQLMEGYFSDWGLTPSEQDIAAFTIKGYSIAEIASLRGSAEATVKTHLNGIYRKAGVSGQSQLVSLLIEDLMRAPLVKGT